AKVIREWALENGWAIYDEAILEEDDKIYEVLVLQRGAMKLTEAETLLGPLLMKQKNDVFKQKWSREVANWTRVETAIKEAARTEENEEKLKELAHLKQLVEEVMNE